MLTAELVRGRHDRKNGEIHIAPLEGKTLARAQELAETYLAIVQSCAREGRTREELEEALSEVPHAPRERLIAEGLQKLIEDRCEFDVSAEVAPDELRGDLFLRAAAARRAGGFSREAVLAETAAARGVAPEAVERCLYADLRGAHVLQLWHAGEGRRLVCAIGLQQRRTSYSDLRIHSDNVGISEARPWADRWRLRRRSARSSFACPLSKGMSRKKHPLSFLASGVTAA